MVWQVSLLNAQNPHLRFWWFEFKPRKELFSKNKFAFVCLDSKYYILEQGFRVICLFTGQYNTKVYDRVTAFI